MSYIVLDLQTDITRSTCDIVNVLRKAHLIAVKLNLTEFDKWLSCELNGYRSDDAIPDYREVRGVLKALNPYHGWIPTSIPNNELEDSICIKRVPNSISEIIALCTLSNDGNDGIVMEFTGEQLELLNRIFSSPLPMKYALHMSTPAIGDIVEKVKNAVLEWTIKLEAEGILGEGMQFSSNEKETAKRIPQTINNYYGNTSVINAPVENSVVIATDSTSIEFSYEKAKRTAAEIEDAIDNEKLSDENMEAVIELLSDIKEKIAQEKKPTVIKAAFIGLKDFLLGVGASATVALVQAKMQGLF